MKFVYVGPLMPIMPSPLAFTWNDFTLLLEKGKKSKTINAKNITDVSHLDTKLPILVILASN